jgi:FixJ family two-component response regulator
MQRQRGVFLYDTLQYKVRGFVDLEEFLARPEINAEGPKILTKVLIPHKVGREIMERLEIMAVTATLLFESHEGAVSDVVNGFNYGRRTGRAWDFP